MNSQENFYNKIYTDTKGDTYMTLFLARSQHGEAPVVVFYSVSYKSQILYLPVERFLSLYTHFDPYEESRKIIESELGVDEIHIERDIAPEPKINKIPRRVKYEDVSKMIEVTLKDYVEPLRSEELYYLIMENEKFKDTDLKLPNFKNNILTKVISENPHIEKIGPALYQYTAKEAVPNVE